MNQDKFPLPYEEAKCVTCSHPKTLHNPLKWYCQANMAFEVPCNCTSFEGEEEKV